MRIKTKDIKAGDVCLTGEIVHSVSILSKTVKVVLTKFGKYRTAEWSLNGTVGMKEVNNVN